jgi:hypothetical protein
MGQNKALPALYATRPPGFNPRNRKGAAASNNS